MPREGKPRAARTVQAYEADTLGAPFKVTLLNSVTLGVDPDTGEETVQIPDVVGLINAVVHARVRHPRKLSGPEIKFIRNALGIKANKIAKLLEMTPEHFSRCESKLIEKGMSVSSEKLFRMFSLLATFFEEPEILLEVDQPETIAPKQAKKPAEMLGHLIKMFLTMNIQTE